MGPVRLEPQGPTTDDSLSKNVAHLAPSTSAQMCVRDGAPAAIRETTELLLEVLHLRLARDEDDPLTAEQIQPIPPTAVDDQSTVRLSVCLYGVSKRGALNTDATAISGDRKEKTPLELELCSLL